MAIYIHIKKKGVCGYELSKSYSIEICTRTSSPSHQVFSSCLTPLILNQNYY